MPIGTALQRLMAHWPRYVVTQGPKAGQSQAPGTFEKLPQKHLRGALSPCHTSHVLVFTTHGTVMITY